MRKFRYLRANEIDVRIGTISGKGCSLLLYKDARCDMNILDETVGPENWQRMHSRDNANCTVSIYDDKKQLWVSKEDVGVKSCFESEKGLASDSFKRACTNWGIGRELYTRPFIWIPADKFELKNTNGKLTTEDEFKVKSIEVTDGVITKLVIINSGKYGNDDDIVFTYPREGKTRKPKLASAPEQEFDNTIDTARLNKLRKKHKEYNYVCGKNYSEGAIAKVYGCSSFEEFDTVKYKRCMDELIKQMEQVKR